jgi:hypothetical protein
VSVDLWHLNSNMSRAKWIKHAITLKGGLFNNYPALKRVTCTISGRYLGFDWRRGDKVITSRIARGLKIAAYVSGIIRVEDT